MRHVLWRSVAAALMAALLAVLAHVVAILFTGGYTLTASGLRISGQSVYVPMIVGLLLLVLSLLIRAPAKGVFSGRQAALLFSLTLTVYLANGKALTSGDTVPVRYLPLSILREGNFDLDEFAFLRAHGIPYYLRLVKGHYVAAYPGGTPRPVAPALLAIPFYVPAAVGGVDPQSPVLDQLEKLSAAVIVSLSAVFVYWSARALTRGGIALLIAVVYAFGTSTLSVSSQALWQHGPSQLVLAASLYCLVRARTKPGWAALAGFPLAVSVVCRPSNVLVAFVLGIYVLVEQRRKIGPFLLCGLPPVAFQLWYNTVYFDTPLGIKGSLGSWSTPVWLGFLGLTLSPGRGLFVYSPIFLLSVVGIVLAWRRNGDRLLRALSVGVVLTILLYSKWHMWWGGHTYGPRLLADLSPSLVLFLYPLGERLIRYPVLKGVVVVALAWSVGAHSIGAFWDKRDWNTDRLWSLTDNQLLELPAEAFNRIAIAVRGLPTSRSDPAQLSASYRTDLPSTTATAFQPMLISLGALNTGTAVWLARADGDHGVVRLRWRWWSAGQAIAGMSGWEPLPFDVFPRQSHEFRLLVPPPPEPGSYTLEAGLVSEGVAWFSELGVPPVRISVTVDAGRALFGWPYGYVEDPPRVALITDRSRYHLGDTVHVEIMIRTGGLPWVVDAYLLLQRPDGEVVAYDGERFLPVANGDLQVPGARSVEVQTGLRGSTRLGSAALAGIPSGTYRLSLILTRVNTNVIVSDARTSIEVVP